MTLSDVNEARARLGLDPLYPRVETIVAAGGRREWKEWLHPRDRKGRWIDKLSRVKVFGPMGGPTFGGVIESLNRDGSARVRITWGKNKRDIGQRVDVPSGSVEKIDAKAVLDTPTPGEVTKPAYKPWSPFRPIATGPAAEMGGGSWKDLKDALNGRDVIVFDTETTGLDPGPGGSDKVVELAAVRMRNGQVVDRFHTMVNPGRPIPPEATNISGITDDDVKNAPSIADAYRSFREYAGGDIVAAHNANFDMDAINSMADDAGDDRMPNGVLDTLALARALMTKSKGDVQGDIDDHRLGTLSEYFGVELENWHRADADAEAAGLLIDKLLDWAIANDRPTDAIQNLGQQIDAWKEKLDAYETELKNWRDETS